MSKQLFLLVILFIFYSSFSQQDVIKPQFSVVFNTAHGKELLHQCSRSTPENITSYRNPSKKDIDSLENNFKRVYSLTNFPCCKMNEIDFTLNDFGYQYLGLVTSGKKCIYVNAFALTYLPHLKESIKDFTKEPIIMCDGGSIAWGVLFDVSTNTFSQLKYNGFIGN